MYSDTIPIPSKGLFYEGKPEYLKVFYMTTEDELNMTALNSFAKGDALNNLLIKNVCEPNNLKLDELLINDKEYLLLFLRDNAYGYVLDYQKDSKSVFFNSQNVRINNIKRPPDAEGFYTFSLNRDIIKTKILRVADEYTINKKTRLGNYIAQIHSINDNTDREYIANYVNYMSLTDSKRLKFFIDAVSFGVDKKTFALIDGVKTEIDLKVDENFFGFTIDNLNKSAKNINDSISFLMNEGNGFTMDGILKMPTHIRRFHEEKLVNKINKINESMKNKK